jgi:hypothetical protein
MTCNKINALRTLDETALKKKSLSSIFLVMLSTITIIFMSQQTSSERVKIAQGEEIVMTLNYMRVNNNGVQKKGNLLHTSSKRKRHVSN